MSDGSGAISWPEMLRDYCLNELMFSLRADFRFESTAAPGARVVPNISPAIDLAGLERGTNVSPAEPGLTFYELDTPLAMRRATAMRSTANNYVFIPGVSS